jgi:hypothetical protein
MVRIDRVSSALSNSTDGGIENLRVSNVLQAFVIYIAF